MTKTTGRATTEPEGVPDRRQCLLVLMGATAEGQQELIAVADGYRESKQSWMDLLVSLRSRGLQIPPKLAIGDGALGSSAALRKLWPETRDQARRSFDAILERYRVKYHRAC